ncbi:MAG: AAA family ATPase [Deltaproteobacteria bacterium]|jgi:hypothetical protein|nr:AAA family ATPase [Deltaproteobacteria bacterium]
MQKLPLGIFTFEKIRHGNFLYVDKTRLVHELAKSDRPTLLSRPHKFGKTLFLSTVKSYFSGRGELFKGLWAEERLPESGPCQVVHLDMARINSNSLLSFRQSLAAQVGKLAWTAGLRPRGRTPWEILFAFITDLSRAKNEKIVLLVDEYETPLVHNLPFPEKIPRVREELSRLYSVVGRARECLRLALFTGVERFERDCLLSGVGDLRDVTLDPAFADVCGLTVAEFDRHFHPYMESVLAFLKDENFLAEELGVEDLRRDILDWYGGYSWDGKTRLISPFYLLHFFRAKEFNSFWHSAKTPSRLVTLLRKHDLAFRLFDRSLSVTPETSVLEPGNLLPVPALFQTGFLSVASAVGRADETKLFLTIPNFACRWLLFVHLTARQFQCKPGHLWAEADQLLRAVRSRRPGFAAAALKRLLGSLRHRSEGPRSGHFRRAFLYTLSILGRPLWFDDDDGPGRVNGIFKGPDNVHYVAQMAYVRPAVEVLPHSAPAGHDGPDGGFHTDDEWGLPRAEVDRRESELEPEALAALRRLDDFDYVGALVRQGLSVVKVALVVGSESVARAAFQEVDPASVAPAAPAPKKAPGAASPKAASHKAPSPPEPSPTEPPPASATRAARTRKLPAGGQNAL